MPLWPAIPYAFISEAVDRLYMDHGQVPALIGAPHRRKGIGKIVREHSS